MIQENQKLNEVLDKAEDFELITDDEITKIYGFKVNGRYIDVLFTKINYEFRTIYNAEYEDADFSNFYNVDFTVDGDVEKHDNSYNENNFKIFATISKILETFVDNNDISGLMAVGNTDNKVKLYEKIFERVLKQKFDKFDVSGNELAVYNVPKNQNLTEVFDKAKDFDLLFDDKFEKKYQFEISGLMIDVNFHKILPQRGLFYEEFAEADFTNLYEVEFTKNGHIEKTDNSYNDNNFIISATISKILESFVQNYDISAIRAHGISDKRGKLYQKIFDRVLKKYFDKIDNFGRTILVYNLAGNQNLSEVLDRTKPYELLDNRDNTKYYSFEAGGQTIDVLFEKIPEKLFEEGDFSDFYKVDFTVDDRLHKPDEPYNNNNFEIFSTISNILEEFAETFEPSGIGATANEINKAKVYRRIFERKLKSKFDKFVYEGKNLAVYNLSEK